MIREPRPAEGEQVDRGLDGRREGRRAPERREVDDLANHHPRTRPRSSRRSGAARGGDRHQSISSPVSSTKTSSRLVTRRSPSSSRRRCSQDRDAVPVRRCAAALARDALDLGQPRGRAVDLERLVPACSATSSRGGADGDRLAVRHDRDGVAEALGLLDVVGRHEDRDALGAQPVDQRPQLLAHLRVEADGRLVEQQEPRLVDERARDQQSAAHAAASSSTLASRRSPRLAMSSARSIAALRSPAGTR